MHGMEHDVEFIIGIGLGDPLHHLFKFEQRPLVEFAQVFIGNAVLAESKSAILPRMKRQVFLILRYASLDCLMMLLDTEMSLR